MLLERVACTSRDVGATRSRKAKTEHLAACLGSAERDEVEIVVKFLSGEMRQGRIGIGYRAVHSVEAEPAGDASLTVREVDARFSDIKEIAGKGSNARRAEALHGLMSRATPEEQRFLRMLLVGELRQGALEGIMADAIARAAGVAAAAVRRAVMLSGDLGEVAKVAFLEGEEALARFAIELFRPLQPMLAQTAEGVDDALSQIEDAALEWKLDGARVQVHRVGTDVRVFTRKLNDVTAAVPEVVEAVLALPVRQIVLDGEALALRDDGSPHPFQTTMRRFGRKLDVERARQSLPLRSFFFDCLHLDGEDLVDRPTGERIGAFDEVASPEIVIPRAVATDSNQADDFLAGALAAGHEGVMAKSLHAAYEAGRRGGSWLKVKPSHTLDLVVLAAEWGSGRRRGWLSNLHLGARDPKTGGFVMLGKTFKGMTDRILEWQTEALQKIELSRDDYTVYVRPELVVEIAFDGVQASPHYPGGMALRFARLKGYRSDKRVDDADAIETVRAIHVKQTGSD